MLKGKTILIAPLDWGLGHATRCVPLIRRLAEHNQVIIGVTAVNEQLFEKYFPSLQRVHVTPYQIRYSSVLPAWLSILFQLPRLTGLIRKEKKLAGHLAGQHRVNTIISDNRPGFRCAGIHSIYITHQLHVPLPLFGAAASALHRNLMKRFSEVWVPDYHEGIRLAGRLSECRKMPRVTYIGPQSALYPPAEPPPQKYDYLVLLSGVEPQRSRLESLVMTAFSELSLKVLLIRGSQTARVNLPSHSTAEVLDFCSAEELSEKILSARTVICRSGYSTLMDLHALGRRDLILVPTPGQPEQEYLAEWWRRHFGARILEQKKLNAAAFRIHSPPARSCTSSCTSRRD